MVRPAADRINKYKRKLVGDIHKQRYDATKDHSVKKEKVYFAQAEALEKKVKQIVDGEPVFLQHFYIAFAEELVTKTTETEQNIVAEKWRARGLDEDKLKELFIIFIGRNPFPFPLDGLLFYYKLNGVAGVVVDETGNYDGTSFGCTRGVAGKIGNAFYFDGNDWVDTSFNEANPINVSVSCWIKLDNLIQDNRILSHGHGFTGFGFGIVNDEMLYTAAGIGSIISIGAGLTTGWHNLVFTKEGTTIKFYLDGDLINTDTLGGPNALTTIWDIGRRTDGAKYFEGKIDETGMWSTILDQSDVTALWNNGAGLTYPS